MTVEQALDGTGNAVGAPQLVLVLLNLAIEQERIERVAVTRRRNVGARDIGAGRCARPGKKRQKSRVVWRKNRQLRDGGERIRS